MAGFDPIVVTDVSTISSKALQSADGAVLSLFTIGETPWDPEQRSAIEASLQAGRVGVLGIHSATDSCAGWDFYGQMLGARFDGHPWTSTLEVGVRDRDHPATRDLPETWKWHDEVYLFRELRPDARILLDLSSGQLDMTVDGARIPDCGLPLAWCHSEGEGRVFQTALGHFPSAWESPTFLKFLAGGLEWLLA